MASMNVRNELHRTVDVPLPGGTVLRVARLPGNGTDPGRLLICHGYGSGDAFRRPAWSESPVQIPDSALPELIEALKALEEET